MSYLVGALSLVPIWALGYLVQRTARIRVPGPEGLVGDFATGVSVFALVGTVMVLLGWLSVLAVYAVLPLAWWTARARGGEEHSSEAGDSWYLPGSRTGRWLTGAAGVVVILLLVTALTDRLTWDGWAIWVLRAKLLFVEGGLPPVVWQKPGPLDFAHPEYPLAIPLLDWWMFRHAGQPLTALGSFVGAVWFACVVTLVWSALRERVGEAMAGLAALGVALFRPISLYAVGGTADVVMTLALLGAVVELHRAVADRPGAGAWLRATVYLALAALSKNEGTAVTVAAVVAVLLWAVLRRRRPPLVVAAFSVPLTLGFGWQIYVRAMGLDVEQIGGLPPAGELLERSGLILEGALRLSVYRSWGPVVGLTILGYVAWTLWRPRETGPEFWLVPLYLGAAVAVYFSTSQDLEWLLATSFPRVVSHAIVAALFVALVGLHAPAREAPS